jgi:hypothetical protein
LSRDNYHRRFVENKGLSVIRPSGRPSGRSPFLRNFEPLLGVLSFAACGSPVFKDLCIVCTLRRCRILADLIERIKSELRETVAHDALWPLPVGVTSHDRGAGFLQPQRGAGPAADQKHSSAAYSYGGSSLLVMLASMGILLNVSQQTE